MDEGGASKGKAREGELDGERVDLETGEEGGRQTGRDRFEKGGEVGLGGRLGAA